MLRTFRFTSILLGLLAAALIAGCSGTDAVDKQGYIKKNNKIQEDAAKTLNKLNASDPASLTAGRTEINKAADKLDKLDVPTDYKSEHKAMTESLRELGAVLGQLATAVKNQDASKMPALQKRLNDSQAKFNKAISDMNADLT